MQAKLQKILSSLKELIEQYKKKKEYQQQLQLHYQRLHILGALRMELFEPFHYGNYHNVRDISIPDNIRIQGYKLINSYPVYYYRLAKQNNQKISATICDVIKKQLNDDIAAYANNIINTNGLDYATSYYYWLTRGVYVLQVIDTEMEIIIAVCTH